MSGVSLGESHGRPITGSTLRRCNDRAGADHVVLIDVDSDTFSNVIFIDVPESTPKKFQCKTSAKKDKRRSPLKNIIFIDDDESSENEYPEFGVENAFHFFHDPSPSMRACSTSKSAKEPPNEIGDDCQFVREKIPPVKLSKCKRTYSGKAPVQNRYGLTSDSESSSSENDEFMEDYSGQLREQWQKASLKRKKYSSGQSGVRDINSASGVRIQPDPGESEEHTSCSDYSNSSTDKEDLSPNSTRESRRTSGMADVHDEGDPRKENFEEGYPSIPPQYRQNPFEKKHPEQGNEGSIPAPGPCLEKPVSCGDRNFSCRQYRVAEEEPFLGKHQCAVETENGRRQYIFTDNGKKCQETAKNYNFHFSKELRHETSRVSFNEKEDLFSGGFPRTTRSSVVYYPEHNYSNGSRVNPRESSICTRASSCSGISGKKCVDQENGKWIPDRTSELDAHNNETQPSNRGSLLEEGLSESLSTSQHKDERHDDVNVQDGENVEGCVENCITTERERMKETSEYKKALEEELASRQRALAIQAEEAKKLKLLLKRKKAESMRLLEMEKRQKQRVEEIRETQKKDVENMNLKELVRAEVRKELRKLEMTCHDMASMLRGLGITVGGGTSHEVRVAYKKALLTFHPDRASKSDIRQQVEAEEKFKLISRMKDKYLPTL
ncbi:uncharacterized protein LOC107789892 [Nicotiana tabacum]|uniref:J domain-containing protein n=1 Tax=Nicotiana tabacum TaxID=4097 RepID=A0A1S3ZSI2_TOBAC|nr:PREDICTED: uncharacterized protein LOC107789892 [Nicotiana tabacum]XP_016467256.1 PREDICTED: uncharacterized protein LOC107789892 [Nicotiana tabacum]XP_016467258.1 PREDICTED: uncharacterized protein LOC107789892 [Nicotiana tabacum]XP_016467259.1 PREDICTED: uncharacterized protein LOC107789892 [Nicotiana tabacum]